MTVCWAGVSSRPGGRLRGVVTHERCPQPGPRSSAAFARLKSWRISRRSLDPGTPGVFCVSRTGCVSQAMPRAEPYQTRRRPPRAPSAADCGSSGSPTTRSSCPSPLTSPMAAIRPFPGREPPQPFRRHGPPSARAAAHCREVAPAAQAAVQAGAKLFISTWDGGQCSAFGQAGAAGCLPIVRALHHNVEAAARGSMHVLLAFQSRLRQLTLHQRSQ